LPALTRIDDPADPRIKAFHAVRERDLVGREGRFVAEGEVVLRTAIRSGRHPLEAVLIAEKRAPGLADALAALPEETPVYVAAQAVLDGIVGFHIHRGILAVGRRGPDPGADALLAGLGPRALVVVLFGIGNHDNMGGIFRNAAAFGAEAVLLGEDCCDPLYRKAIRVSVGAALTTPFATVGPDALDILARYGFEALALTPTGGEVLATVRRADRAALVLGAEGPGLPADMLARARRISIPMAGTFDSLNVAATSAVALHQMVFGAS
jgi:tRNA G18 (ribose-2'-O)-methylase SpoU